MNHENVVILIAKFLNKEANANEIALIKNWCAESEENKKEFITLRDIWIHSDSRNNELIADAKLLVWDKITSQTIDKKRPKSYTKKALIYYSSIAAVVAILLMTCLNIYKDDSYNRAEQYTDFSMPRGEKGQIFLPDGTQVWLNSYSRIRIGNHFGANKERRIYLEGQAYFDVAKNEDSKFIVETDVVNILVHGTAFNITSFPQSSDVKVSLQRGSVSIVNNKTQQEMTVLKPNQQASIAKDTYALNISSCNMDNLLAWTSDELVFEQVSADEMFAKMEHWYDIKIKATAVPRDVQYRFKVREESVGEIFQLINKITPINYQINGKEVIVNYK